MLSSRSLRLFHRTMMHCHAGVGIAGVALATVYNEPAFLFISAFNLAFGVLSWYMGTADK